MTLTAYATPLEQRIARALIRAALRDDLAVSINDGEEWTVVRSRDVTHITEHLATTGADTLRLTTADNALVGEILLIWGNEEDLVSDCTDNSRTLEIVEAARNAML